MHRYSMIAEQPQPQTEETLQSKLLRMLLPVLIIIVGMGVLMYPVIATQWNNIQQQKVTEDYAQFVDNQPEEVRNQMFEAALQYNAEQEGSPILDPWLAEITEDNPEYQHYLQQLQTGSAMAQIVVPSAKVKLPVYHGSDEKTLEKGVGHLFGTSLPVGGESTHSVLTGHTGLANATLFDNLIDVREGDAIYLNVLGNPLKYEVDQINVVLPKEVEHLAVVEGEDLVTLITCTPYGINSHRLLVRGHRVPMEPGEEKLLEEQGGLVWQWWMLAAIAACSLIFIILFVWMWRTLRGGRNTNNSTQDQEHDDD
ncbi:MAG: class C sortase [Corynebacterium sp.]|nr:class C sortase [Corynebacterium sp.]